MERGEGRRCRRQEEGGREEEGRKEGSKEGRFAQAVFFFSKRVPNQRRVWENAGIAADILKNEALA